MKLPSPRRRPFGLPLDSANSMSCNSLEFRPVISSMTKGRLRAIATRFRSAFMVLPFSLAVTDRLSAPPYIDTATLHVVVLPRPLSPVKAMGMPCHISDSANATSGAPKAAQMRNW